MNGITFYTHGDEPALLKAAERLRMIGVSVVDAPSENVTHLLCSVPSFDQEGKLKGGGRVDDLLSKLPEDITVIGGNLPKDVFANHSVIDLLHDEMYLAENAAITADCAMALARQHLDVIWKGCPVLILGWGRIGKCLAQLLRNAGADVTIAARKVTDIAMLKALGYGADHIYHLYYGLLRYRVIFNTVPQPVLRQEQTAHCREDCLLVELASTPGIDGKGVISALGLPGKMAPESSGRLIANTTIRALLGKEY